MLESQVVATAQGQPVWQQDAPSLTPSLPAVAKPLRSR